jgi:hypothetical protein
MCLAKRKKNLKSSSSFTKEMFTKENVLNEAISSWKRCYQEHNKCGKFLSTTINICRAALYRASTFLLFTF